ncbi:Ankyrin repeat-containing domain protein [Ophiocordyceps camponoti-floridani]|uniref:Ankyrin repeat-containing domain protein n=1 Tax=Ophiocordyceps camponoti-floridani TaxID=2030778 RepID=A0A8H4Q2U0_9HYPO|nr:Ankyrin repeat-containing domain protein [Ophiocordyceps camponoti-floridani]
MATNPLTLSVPVHMSSLGQEFLTLGVNVILTLSIDGMMFVHSVSLRWALYHEKRLDYNTNIRLLTSSSKSGPNQWYSNAATLFFLVLSYGSSSVLVLLRGDPNKVFFADRDGPPTRPALNAIALIGLGIALAGQASIAVWCLISSSHLIPTWSSNPLNTTLAAMQKGSLTHRPGRSMLSVHQKQQHSILGSYPLKRQGTMIKAQRSVFYILIFLWVLAAAAVAWLATIMVLARERSGLKCWRPALEWVITSNCSWNWVSFPAPPRLMYNLPETFSFSRPYTYSQSYSYSQQAILNLVFTSAIQGLQTIGLHCVELIVNMSRDESSWRSAHSETRQGAKGLQLSTSPFRAALSSWENAVLLVAKAALHWAASQAMASYGYPDLMGTVFATVVIFVYPRIALYAFLAFLLAVFATSLALRRPRGCQPATMGHLQTIADLVDDWETDETGRMWWGDKTGHLSEGMVLRHAGTSGDRRLLSGIDFEAIYS